jgi:hypothetical protein
MIKKNSTFPLSAAVAATMTEEIRINFVFLFFAAAVLRKLHLLPRPRWRLKSLPSSRLLRLIRGSL